jgi:glycosyltransferase involved in cell wall biosynthesis
VKTIIPVSAIIATRHRSAICGQLLDSIAAQDTIPSEILFCDSSEDNDTALVTAARQPEFAALGSSVIWQKAAARGAAPQRNEAVATATQPDVLIMDDDITLEPGCLTALWKAQQDQPSAGGFTATILNEAYTPPGSWTRRILKWLDGGRERSSYAGTCIGPGWTFWPADDKSLPDTVPVEWMGTGLALYRREVLPKPPFAAIFTEASLCEDLALSLTVAKKAPLFQASRSRYVHLNVGGSHKKSLRRNAAMALVNRHYVLTQVMGKTSISDAAKLGVMLLFQLLGTLRQTGLLGFLQVAAGYVQGFCKVAFHRPATA